MHRLLENIGEEIMVKVIYAPYNRIIIDCDDISMMMDIIWSVMINVC